VLGLDREHGHWQRRRDHDHHGLVGQRDPASRRDNSSRRGSVGQRRAPRGRASRASRARQRVRDGGSHEQSGRLAAWHREHVRVRGRRRGKRDLVVLGPSDARDGTAASARALGVARSAITPRPVFCAYASRGVGRTVRTMSGTPHSRRFTRAVGWTRLPRANDSADHSKRSRHSSHSPYTAAPASQVGPAIRKYTRNGPRISRPKTDATIASSNSATKPTTSKRQKHSPAAAPVEAPPTLAEYRESFGRSSGQVLCTRIHTHGTNTNSASVTTKESTSLQTIYAGGGPTATRAPRPHPRRKRNLDQSAHPRVVAADFCMIERHTIVETRRDRGHSDRPLASTGFHGFRKSHSWCSRWRVYPRESPSRDLSRSLRVDGHNQSEPEKSRGPREPREQQGDEREVDRRRARSYERVSRSTCIFRGDHESRGCLVGSNASEDGVHVFDATVVNTLTL